MDCSYHQEFNKQFKESGKRVGYTNCCDIMGCFNFHPNVNPEFMDNPENADYIKKHTVFSWKNLTKADIEKIEKERGSSNEVASVRKRQSRKAKEA